MWRILAAVAVMLAAGCSVTGRVRVNPAIPTGQYITHKLPVVGPVCGELEFKHEF